MKEMIEKQFESYTIRVAPELFKQVQRQAEDNERSTNKEIVFILKDYFKRKEEQR